MPCHASGGPDMKFDYAFCSRNEEKKNSSSPPGSMPSSWLNGANPDGVRTIHARAEPQQTMAASTRDSMSGSRRRRVPTLQWRSMTPYPRAGPLPPLLEQTLRPD